MGCLGVRLGQVFEVFFMLWNSISIICVNWNVVLKQMTFPTYIFLLEKVKTRVGSQDEEPLAPLRNGSGFRSAGSSRENGSAEFPEISGMKGHLRVVEPALGNVDRVFRIGQLGYPGQPQFQFVTPYVKVETNLAWCYDR